MIRAPARAVVHAASTQSTLAGFALGGLSLSDSDGCDGGAWPAARQVRGGTVFSNGVIALRGTEPGW